MSSGGALDTTGAAPDYWSAEPLCPGTWLIKTDGCTSYLVVGDERGLVIDTGFDTNNIQAYAQALTDKPVLWVANTHGHFDHTAGDGWFDLAYMSAEAAKIAKIPYPSKAKNTYPLDYPIEVVAEGDKIELGGRDLEVIEIPAHAPSSVAYLDRKQRILFSGDEATPFVMLYWQQDEPQPTIEQYARNMQKLVARRWEFDYVCWGHGDGLLDASLVDDCLANARQILSGVEGEPMVLSEDGPEDFVMHKLEYKRVSNYGQSHIGYDVRYVFDRRENSHEARG
ncbi:MAG: MBL fold metallo-hydrolase [Armatimonadetes bacterium]|nr:MBL fold metallo-hydrolase [Armatimonadota bacterium]